MDADTMTAWLDDLARTTAPQFRGRLSGHVATPDGNRIGYCCLGRGEVVRTGLSEGARIRGSLPSREFVDWLGLDVGNHDSRFAHSSAEDCVCEFNLEVDVTFIDPRGDVVTLDPLSASELNDGKNCGAEGQPDQFTFAQIADLFRYFGVARVTTP